MAAADDWEVNINVNKVLEWVWSLDGDFPGQQDYELDGKRLDDAHWNALNRLTTKAAAVLECSEPDVKLALGTKGAGGDIPVPGPGANARKDVLRRVLFAVQLAHVTGEVPDGYQDAETGIVITVETTVEEGDSDSDVAASADDDTASGGDDSMPGLAGPSGTDSDDDLDVEEDDVSDADDRGDEPEFDLDGDSSSDAQVVESDMARAYRYSFQTLGAEDKQRKASKPRKRKAGKTRAKAAPSTAARLAAAITKAVRKGNFAKVRTLREAAQADKVDVDHKKQQVLASKLEKALAAGNDARVDELLNRAQRDHARDRHAKQYAKRSVAEADMSDDDDVGEQRRRGRGARRRKAGQSAGKSGRRKKKGAKQSRHRKDSSGSDSSSSESTASSSDSEGAAAAYLDAQQSKTFRKANEAGAVNGTGGLNMDRAAHLQKQLPKSLHRRVVVEGTLDIPMARVLMQSAGRSGSGKKSWVDVQLEKDAWGKAWDMFAGIMLEMGSRQDELDSYKTMILNYYDDYKQTNKFGAYEFDALYRAEAASMWHATGGCLPDWQFSQRIFNAVFATCRVARCSLCGSPDHRDGEHKHGDGGGGGGGGGGGRKDRGVKTDVTDKGGGGGGSKTEKACFDWNNGTCSYEKCRFGHFCKNVIAGKVCKGKHKAGACPNKG